MRLTKPTTTRGQLGLSQREYGYWTGLSRDVIASVETGRQTCPLLLAQAEIRLLLALEGKVVNAANSPVPAPPPLLLPPPDPAPLAQRIATLRLTIPRLQAELVAMPARAAPYALRYRILPALHTYATPIQDVESDAQWLRHFEYDAQDALLNVCGAGPQRLLAARIVGLQAELAALTAPDEAVGA